MSNKRTLSPESRHSSINENNIRSLKRLKLRSIVQNLRNEEANLVILKKLRSSQQLSTRTNNISKINGFHSSTTYIPTNKSSTPIFSSTNSSARSSLQRPVLSATRKSFNTATSVKIPTKSSSSTIHSLEERTIQAKKALCSQLERDLLNIPSPKPLLRDILFIPNSTSLEFQSYVGLEDVVQCLYELQADRQRLPQRFTDRAQIDEPSICDHCGTDFTIRWRKHLNNNQQTNVLCDRCKKQTIRRTLKTEHSTLFKNVCFSAMKQEKEIEKTFQTLIKQQEKSASRTSSSSSKSTTNSSRSVPSQIQSITSHPFNNHQQQQKTRTKISLPQTQNFATKLSQQTTTRKSISTMNSINNVRSKPPVPAHQQFRFAADLSQQMRNNHVIKSLKTSVRQQPVVPSRPMYPSTSGIASSCSSIHPLISSSANIRPTATKRRTLPTDNMK